MCTPYTGLGVVYTGLGDVYSLHQLDMLVEVCTLYTGLGNNTLHTGLWDVYTVHWTMRFIHCTLY